MEGRIRESSLLQTPYIKIRATITMPGYTNGIPNIKEEDRYVVAPSAKKIATYIRNQLFGSELITETENLDVISIESSVETYKKLVIATKNLWTIERQLKHTKNVK